MNIIERFINIIVNNKEANIELEKTTQQLNNVDKATEQVTQKTDLHTQKTQQNSKSIRENGGLMGFLGAATRGASNDVRDAIEAFEGFGVSLKGLGGALAATGIAIGALGLLWVIDNWEKVKDVIVRTTFETKALNSIQKDLNNELKKVYSELFKVKSAFDQAKNGAISKKDALETYNKTLGDTFGKAKSLDEAERLYVEKTPDYIKAVELRMTAQLLLGKAAEEAAKIATGEAGDLGWWDSIILGTKAFTESIFFGINEASKSSQELAKKMSADNVKEANANKDKLLKLYEEFQRKADELSKKGGLKFEQNKTQEISKQNELLKQQSDLYKSILANLTKQSDIIINTVNKLRELKSPTLTGEIANSFKELANILETGDVAIMSYNKSIGELETSYSKLINTYKSIKNPSKEQRDDFEKNSKNYIIQIDNLKKVRNSTTEALNETRELMKTYNENSEKTKNSIDDAQKANERLNNLKIESIKLDNKILDYENSISKYGDDRLNNSNKFLEIGKLIEEQFKVRKKIIEETFKAEKKQAQEKVDSDKKTLKDKEDLYSKTKQQQELDEKRAKDLENLINSDAFNKLPFEERVSLQKEYDDLQITLSKNAAKIVELKGQTLQAQTNLKNSELELDRIVGDEKVAIADEIAKKERAIFDNENNYKTAQREEQLERQRMFFDKSIAIADEAANTLDAIAAISGKKGEKFAEAALKIRKAAGVASVVISTQEEIRGIWSNPALSALPPNIGIPKKVALTALAVGRGALSVATILSQKLSSSGGGNVGGDVGAPANFNIVGSSGTNQLAATIGAQQNRPVQAYVVGADVETAQALSRNRINTATFL